MSSAPSFAAVVLAHTDPAHLRRLVRALEDVPVFLHVDAKTPDPVYRDMLGGLPDRARPVPRIPTSLASWSLVRAELAALRSALDETTATHVGILSGADYPLVSMADLRDELSGAGERSLMWNTPLPFRPWDTPRYPDGGLWRLRHRFVVRGDQLVHVRGMPLRWPLQRSLPAGVQPRASTQWKVYTRRDAALLLDVVDRRPDLVRFWRTTLVPEETFVASVLGSPEIVGDEVLPPSTVDRWFISWSSDDSHHPDWLVEEDLAGLSAGRWALPAEGAPDAGQPPVRRLFARKFSSEAPQVLERIDAELRS